jgi:hypothetical protein
MPVLYITKEWTKDKPLCPNPAYSFPQNEFFFSDALKNVIAAHICKYYHVLHLGKAFLPPKTQNLIVKERLRKVLK